MALDYPRASVIADAIDAEHQAFGLPLYIRAHMFMAATQTNRWHVEGRHFLCHLAREIYCRDFGRIRSFSDLCSAFSEKYTDQR
jgi:predicted HD phosphohydrolase